MEQIQNEKKILNHLVGDLSQAVVEGSAILPAGMPEMARILMVTPYAEVASAEPDQGRVAVEGNLTLLICYLCADGLTHSFESTSVFRSTVEVEGAQPGMGCVVEALPSAVEYTLGSGRDLSVHAIVDLCCVLEEDVPLLALAFEDAPQNMSALPAEAHFTRSARRMSLTGEIQGSVPIPSGIAPVERVLFASGFAEIKRTMFDGETLGIEGELKLNVLYSTGEDSAPVSQIYGSLEFSEVVPADGVDGDIEVRAQVGRIQCTLDDAGEALEISALCKMAVSCRRRFGFVGIKDAYAEHCRTDLEYQRINTMDKCLMKTGTNAVWERMQLGEEAVPARILCCNLTPGVCRAYDQGGMLVMEGMLGCQVVYVGYDGAINTVSGEVPVRLEEPAMDLAGATQLTAQIWADQVQAVPAGDEVEVRALVQYRCDGYRPAAMDLVTVIRQDEEEAAERTPSGIIVYFIQPGDTLWDVAKRYRINQDVILAQNPGVEDQLVAGQKLLLISRPV